MTGKSDARLIVEGLKAVIIGNMCIETIKRWTFGLCYMTNKRPLNKEVMSVLRHSKVYGIKHAKGTVKDFKENFCLLPLSSPL